MGVLRGMPRCYPVILDGVELTALHFEALARAKGLPMHPNAIEKVARQTSTEAARWAFGQWELRARAANKFAQAREMLFDRDGLEMASHERVAAYHAGLFPKGELVMDLCCGIGSDLIALAKRGPVIGFELDPVRLRYAQHNLRVHEAEAELRLKDALQEEWAGYVFADPARRSGGQRHELISLYEPSPVAIREQFEATIGAKRLVMKLSPMLPDEHLGKSVEFLSFQGECREALSISDREGIWAVHLDSGERLPQMPDPVPTDTPGKYLFDADPAAIRAHALGIFRLGSLGDHPGYLTGDELVRSPWLRAYEVLEVLPANEKKLASLLKEAGTLVLKQRGAGLDLQKLEPRLRGKGKTSRTVVFYKEGPVVRALLCNSVP
jgi:SAM-dependent methyltransferase